MPFDPSEQRMLGERLVVEGRLRVLLRGEEGHFRGREAAPAVSSVGVVLLCPAVLGAGSL